MTISINIKTFLVSFWEELGDNQGLFVGIAAAIGSWKLFGPSIKKGFSGLINSGDTKTAVQQATQNVGGISDSVGGKGGGLNSKLTSLAKNMGLVLVVIIEASVAIDIVVGEVWILGKMLEKVGEAWQPVIENGDRIAEEIKLGTELLVGVGLAAAALGGLTMLTGGGLAAAILIGVGVLSAATWAFKKFSDSLIDVANELKDRLAPALDDANGILPDVSSDMSDFVDFMEEFASQVGRYTKATAISALDGMIDTVIGWFTKDPIERMAGKVQKTYNQVLTLNSNLELANPELEKASGLLEEYERWMNDISTTIEGSSTEFGDVDISTFRDNLKEFGSAIKDFYDKIKKVNFATVDSASDSIKNLATVSSQLKSIDTNKMISFGDAAAKMGKSLSGADWSQVSCDFVSGFSDMVQSAGSSADSIKTSVDNMAAISTSSSNIKTSTTNMSSAFSTAKTSISQSASNMKTTISGMAASLSSSVSSIEKAFSGLGTSVSGSLQTAINTASNKGLVKRWKKRCRQHKQWLQQQLLQNNKGRQLRP